MKAWSIAVPALAITALAMVPQDPNSADPSLVDQSAVASISELNYINLQGTSVNVPARSVVEIRFLDDAGEHIRLELLYENGDYSLLTVQGFHLLRNNGSAREVRLVRGKSTRMRFPRLP
ncbi:MAG: hypothetical protein JNK15_21605 [Planctomycetes bacterium]|nr:hypothetical protein [Planctomycetota bacterium]